MGNALLNYLNKRLEESKPFRKSGLGPAGPVITISRQVGCNGIPLARALAAKLNQQKMLTEWKVLSKEVFFWSARELNLEPEQIRKMFKKADNYIFEQILTAFGEKRYKSEAKISKTVRDVIHSLSVDGYNIIVGRASHIIAHDIKNAFHIRLTAPMDYRIDTIMVNNKLNRNDAIDFINKVEKERISFRKALKADPQIEDNFDMTINRATFNTEDCVDLILYAIEKKKILADYKQKIEFF
ncbi:AAA family ATPase [Maribellus mangrovi]|uniref:cytidylate kinase-like family protein n=1 Tax=Maribellus mangrovi TaxID=3133146 RepID=UPI0030EE2D19